MRIASLVAAILLPTFALAQSPSITIETIPLPDQDEQSPIEGTDPNFTVDGEPVIGFTNRRERRQTIIEETNEKGERGAGAVLRALDKVSGATTDIELTSGENAQVFALDVGLTECRFPAGNPSGDAFAYLVIREPAKGGDVFSGWMIASSPALSALDHARYDVWVLRCITS